jgi:ubiquinone/menaquinone biosynthesis C-methylase UbiE
MSLSIAEWHMRYTQQAEWTQNLRRYLYNKANLIHSTRILDVGCGTGVLEGELSSNARSISFGLDINLSPLKFARQFASKALYTQGDCLFLPYAEQVFDITFCHFLLLWVKNTQNTVAEMVRVTHPDGYVIAIAEPDYGGRIDYPPELSRIGAWQTDALRKQGANPNMGRELRAIFTQAGLVDVEVGVMGGQWGMDRSDRDNNLEWEVIRSDLRVVGEFLSLADELEALDNASRIESKRILFVPTFYAIGTKK